MKPFRLVQYALSVVLAVLAVMIGDVREGLAQGKLDARYAVTLAGVPVGRGTWVIDIAEDHFSATASGQTAGLLRVFASGHGQSAVRGSAS